MAVWVIPGLTTGITTPCVGVKRRSRSRPLLRLIRVPSSGVANGRPRPLIPRDEREPIAMERRAARKRR